MNLVDSVLRDHLEQCLTELETRSLHPATTQTETWGRSGRTLPWINTQVNEFCLCGWSRISFVPTAVLPVTQASVRRSNPHGSSCSACFSEMPIAACGAWRAAWSCAWPVERGWTWKPSFQLHVLILLDYSISFLFFTSLSLFFFL